MISVSDAGVDTWKPSWYVGEASPAYRAMTELATSGRGFARLVPESIGRHRVVFNPETGLVAAEGHPVENGLAGAADLPAAFAQLVEDLHAYGVQVPEYEREGFDHGRRREGFDGVGRLDVTVDVASTALEGRAQLHGLATLDMNRSWGREPRFDGPHLNSVTWRSTRGVAGRVYDKNVEQGLTMHRGERIRYEAQRRFPAGVRRTIDELTSYELHRQFHQRLRPLGRATEGVKVMTHSTAIDELLAKIADGDITPVEAEQVLAYQQLAERAHGRRIPGQSRPTDWRRRDLVRRVGVVLSSGLTDEVQVSLHEVFDRAEPGVFAGGKTRGSAARG